MGQEAQAESAGSSRYSNLSGEGSAGRLEQENVMSEQRHVKVNES